MSRSRPRANSNAVAPLTRMQAPFGKGRMEQPADRFGADCADRDQQEQRIGECGEYRRFLETVGKARRCGFAGHDRAGPRNHQAEDVRQIMASIGEQRHRVGEKAEDCLDDDEAEVQPDPDRKRPAVIGPPTGGAMVVAVRVAGGHLRRLA